MSPATRTRVLDRTDVLVAPVPDECGSATGRSPQLLSVVLKVWVGDAHTDCGEIRFFEGVRCTVTKQTAMDEVMQRPMLLFLLLAGLADVVTCLVNGVPDACLVHHLVQQAGLQVVGPGSTYREVGVGRTPEEHRQNLPFAML